MSPEPKVGRFLRQGVVLNTFRAVNLQLVQLISVLLRRCERAFKRTCCPSVCMSVSRMISSKAVRFGAMATLEH